MVPKSNGAFRALRLIISNNGSIAHNRQDFIVIFILYIISLDCRKALLFSLRNRKGSPYLNACMFCGLGNSLLITDTLKKERDNKIYN